MIENLTLVVPYRDAREGLNRRKSVALMCRQCGESFVRELARARRGGRFCSRECYDAYRGLRLVGMRYGRLVVENQGRSGYVLLCRCRCDCGREVTVHSANLIAGRTSSCGCRNQEMRGSTTRIVHEPGTRFGRLTVLGREGALGKKSMFRCRCDCGAIVIARGTHLRSGAIKSCGCYSHDQMKKRNTTHGLTHTPEYMQSRKQKRSRLDRIWTVHMSMLLRNLQQQCVICGSAERLSVDHVRPLAKGNGLQPGNAVMLCRSCNSRKNDKDFEELPPDWQDKLAAAAGEFAEAWRVSQI